MKTKLFFDNYNAIKFFCANVKNGFCVAEINDSPTAKEFIQQLKSEFDIFLCSHEVLRTNRKISAEVVVIDETETVDLDQLVVDLNFERNLFIDLKKPVVFLLNSSSIDKLIRYSASFWSCVSLHKVFYSEYKTIFEPHFLSKSYDNSLNGIIQTISSKRNQTTNSKREKIREIVNIIFGYDNLSSDLVSFLVVRYDNINKKDANAIEVFAFKILFLLENLQTAGFLDEAENCIELFYQLFDVSKNSWQANWKLLRNAAEIKYKKGDYQASEKIYTDLYKHLNNQNNLSDEELAVLINNIGVVYYKLGIYDEALTCFNQAATLVNERYDVFPLIHVLYNLSIIHWVIKDFENAFYYIENAIELTKKEASYQNSILHQIFIVFLSYLQINRGERNTTEHQLIEALAFFRSNLTENCISVMETHYVFSIQYYYSNQFEKAYSCAKKAYVISKQLAVPLEIRVQLRELLGEICYYSDNISEAHHYFATSLPYAEKHSLFAPEVFEWVRKFQELS